MQVAPVWFINKVYYFYIHQNMTLLTAEGNFWWQPDNCYIIVYGVCIVLTVDDAGCWLEELWATLNYIKLTSSQ